MKFRVKKSVNVPTEVQGYIYYSCLCYRRLGEQEQKRIKRLCKECGGYNHGALFEFVTTDHGADGVCLRHHIGSKTTLYALVKAFYEAFAGEL